MNDITAREAREQLDRAAGPGMASRHDRRMHAWVLGVSGLLIPVDLLLTKAAEDHQDWRNLLNATYVALVLGLTWWLRRATRTVPRHARLVEFLGVGATVLLSLAALGVVGVWDHAGVYVVSALVAAAPALVAAVVLGRGGRA